MRGTTSSPHNPAPESLGCLNPGACGTVASLNCHPNLKRRLMDMGLTPGAEVSVEGTAPLGDPIIVCARGCRLAIRRAEAAGINVTQPPCGGLSGPPCRRGHRGGRQRRRRNRFLFCL